jgi:hypothetical protein
MFDSTGLRNRASLPLCPMVEPQTGGYPDFPNSFGMGILGSSPQASGSGILLVVERDDPPEEEWVGKEERHVHRTT